MLTVQTRIRPAPQLEAATKPSTAVITRSFGYSLSITLVCVLWIDAGIPSAEHLLPWLMPLVTIAAAVFFTGLLVTGGEGGFLSRQAQRRPILYLSAGLLASTILTSFAVSVGIAKPFVPPLVAALIAATAGHFDLVSTGRGMWAGLLASASLLVAYAAGGHIAFLSSGSVSSDAFGMSLGFLVLASCVYCFDSLRVIGLHVPKVFGHPQLQGWIGDLDGDLAAVPESTFYDLASVFDDSADSMMRRKMYKHYVYIPHMISIFTTALLLTVAPLALGDVGPLSALGGALLPVGMLYLMLGRGYSLTVGFYPRNVAKRAFRSRRILAIAIPAILVALSWLQAVTPIPEGSIWLPSDNVWEFATPVSEGITLLGILVAVLQLVQSVMGKEGLSRRFEIEKAYLKYDAGKWAVVAVMAWAYSIEANFIHTRLRGWDVRPVESWDSIAAVALGMSVLLGAASLVAFIALRFVRWSALYNRASQKAGRFGADRIRAQLIEKVRLACRLPDGALLSGECLTGASLYRDAIALECDRLVSLDSSAEHAFLALVRDLSRHPVKAAMEACWCVVAASCLDSPRATARYLREFRETDKRLPEHASARLEVAVANCILEMREPLRRARVLLASVLDEGFDRAGERAYGICAKVVRGVGRSLENGLNQAEKVEQ